MRRRSLALSAFAAACIAGAGCGSGPPPPDQAIVILVDTLRPDRTSVYGYGRDTTPRLARLAERGVVFLNHYAQATYTRASLPRMLYSRYHVPPLFPSSRDAPIYGHAALFRRLDDEALSLPRALERAGFATAMVSAHAWLREDTAFAREFQEAFDLSGEVASASVGHPEAEVVIERAVRWIEAHQDEPYLLYLHLMEPHVPLPFDDDARALFGEGAPPVDAFNEEFGSPRDRSRALAGDERRYLDALYDGQIRAVDRAIGGLLDFLEARGRLESTVLAVLSDHGENLLEVPERFGHGGPWYEGVARVPFLLHHPPSLPSARIDALTESTDLHPTLLALLGVDLPRGKSLDGTNLLPLIHGRARGDDHAIGMASIRDERFKALFRMGDGRILDEDDDGELRGRLYDLHADPLEQVDLWEERPEVVARLARAYRERMREPWERWTGATSDAQPTFVFALGVDDGSPPALPEVAEGFGPLACGDVGPPWRIRSHYERPYVLARAGAPPLHLAFAVPDGHYRLHVQVLGRGAVHLPAQGRRHPVSGPPVEGPERPAWRQRAVDVPLGEVVVRDRSLRVTLEPDAGGCLAVRLFGFEPRVEGAPSTALEPERIERLRALGYVE